MTAARTVNLPAPDADGIIRVSPYRLDRWEHRGLATLGWLGDSRTETAYTIGGVVYHYLGERLAPRHEGNARRRTFFIAELRAVGGAS